VYLGAKRRYINTLPFLFPFSFSPPTSEPPWKPAGGVEQRCKVDSGDRRPRRSAKPPQSISYILSHKKTSGTKNTGITMMKLPDLG